MNDDSCGLGSGRRRTNAKNEGKSRLASDSRQSNRVERDSRQSSSRSHEQRESGTKRLVGITVNDCLSELEWASSRK